MKKLLVLLVIGCAFFAFTSCKKGCTCKDKTTKAEVEFTEEELEGLTCKEAQNEINADEEWGKPAGYNWSCK